LPKKATEIGALAVKRMTLPGTHAVGGAAGLALQVKDSGARSWILRATVGSVRRHIGLGGFPDVPLAAARDRAREVRDQIRAGVDPIEFRKSVRDAQRKASARGLTFSQAAERWHRSKSVEYRNQKHAAQVLSTIAAYAGPVIGDLSVAMITLSDVVRVLEPIWASKTETASRLRGRIESVLNWATVSGFRSGDNPARWRGNLDAVLPKPARVRHIEHHRALTAEDMPAFMSDLRQVDGMGARALEYLVLTATRSGEVRHATWDELDLRSRVWTIPGRRMKAGREHRVPLSDQAVKLLRSLPRFQDSPFVFAAPRGGALSDMTLSAVLRRMNVHAVPHGFRSTFRDWAAERTNFPSEVVEMALAHTITNKVEAAYRRGDLFDKRRKLMADWARHCWFDHHEPPRSSP
jgi:integrase